MRLACSGRSPFFSFFRGFAIGISVFLLLLSLFFFVFFIRRKVINNSPFVAFYFSKLKRKKGKQVSKFGTQMKKAIQEKVRGRELMLQYVKNFIFPLVCQFFSGILLVYYDCYE